MTCVTITLFWAGLPVQSSSGWAGFPKQNLSQWLDLVSTGQVPFTSQYSPVTTNKWPINRLRELWNQPAINKTANKQVRNFLLTSRIWWQDEPITFGDCVYLVTLSAANGALSAWCRGQRSSTCHRFIFKVIIRTASHNKDTRYRSS